MVATNQPLFFVFNEKCPGGPHVFEDKSIGIDKNHEIWSGDFLQVGKFGIDKIEIWVPDAVGHKFVSDENWMGAVVSQAHVVPRHRQVHVHLEILETHSVTHFRFSENSSFKKLSPLFELWKTT